MFLTFLGKNLHALKQELELDVHRVDLDELCKRFNTNLDRGMTKTAAQEGNAKYGLNALTPPPTTPGTITRSLHCRTGRVVIQLVETFFVVTIG